MDRDELQIMLETIGNTQAHRSAVCLGVVNRETMDDLVESICNGWMNRFNLRVIEDDDIVSYTERMVFEWYANRQDY